MIEQTELEQLREKVESISEAARKIRESGISEPALLLLIQHNAPSPYPKGPKYGRKISKAEISAVIDGMESLADFVFDGEGEDG